MADVYTVTSLTRYISALFDSDLRLRSLNVEGEVSNFRPAASGHWYFTLKDDKSALRCVMWRSSASAQAYTPSDGDRVMAHGYVGVYETRGEYQLYADLIQPAGLGDLHAQFEALKAKLAAEGLFDPEHKRPLPGLPKRIGVVTSPTAAAFQDVLNVLRRRCPLAEVILSPTLVQGAEAPPQIVRALEQLNDHTNADVILMIRGGGSLEDLWAFNDERVARAVYESRVPVISGVGHEIDFTIIDFVADVRAPTPSAAAELAVPDLTEIHYAVQGAAERQQAAVQEHINEQRRLLEVEDRALRGLSPQRRIDDARQQLDDLLRHNIQLRDVHLQSRRDALAAADPRAILARGYAIVERIADGKRLTRAADASSGDAIRVRLSEGSFTATVDTTDHD